MEKGDKLTGGPYWTQNWIEAMWRFTAERFVDFDTGTVDFEALGREEYEFRKALFFRNFKNSPRAMEAFDAAADDYSKKVANGQKGGRPKKSPQDAPNGNAGVDSVRGTPSHSAPARPRASFRNKEEFIQWAIDDGLDPVDAGECWEATEERGGKDADGNTVKNMKAFARQWCRTRKTNRRTA